MSEPRHVRPTSGQRRAARATSATGRRLAGLALTLLAGSVPLVWGPGAAVATAATEQKVYRSDALVDSICVATHWGYKDTPYGQQYAAVRDRLLASGIRFDRDQTNDPAIISRLQAMASRGVKFILAMDGGLGIKPSSNYWSQPPGVLVNAYLKNIGASNVADIEGPNEIDLSYGRWKWHPNDTQTLTDDASSPLFWAKFLPGYTQATYDAVNGDPQTASVPVLGPSLTSTQAYDAAGDLSKSVDAANVHWYLAGHHPETGGWGDDGYGSLQWVKQHMAAAQAPGKPILVTEGGYSNAVNQNPQNVPEDIEALYLPRLLLTAFAGGIQRFCTYELIDEFPDPGKTHAEKNFGLLRNDLSIKPAYTALQNLIKLTQDPGGTFATTPLSYQLTGTDSATEQLLLQKRDGSYLLALWQGAPSWDPNTGQRITAATQKVTLTLPTAANSIKTYRPDRGTSPLAAASNVSTVTVTSGSAVTLIEIR